MYLNIFGGHQKPLSMLMGGAGGTGKSRVIAALSDLFRRMNQGRRFRVAAFTGVAAAGVSGMTLHSALNLQQLRNMMSGTATRSKKELIEAWEGVDFLFIDEVSMVGAELLHDISNALSIAKESSEPFGGINVIFAGDFYQLPPVGCTPLYASLESITSKEGDSQTNAGQRKIKGMHLWKSLDHVVLLTESMRQSGPENEAFRKLLARLRFGNCTPSDIKLLNTRILGRANVNLRSPHWRNAPIITRSNSVKDALNRRAMEAFASRSLNNIEHYWSQDYLKKSLVRDEKLATYLQNLHSGQTSHLSADLAMVHGMPVIISENFDVSGGIVNGSEGILKSVRYKLDDRGRRIATSAIVTVTKSSGDTLPGLPPYDVVVLPQSCYFTIKHPESRGEVTYKRRQLPLQPAFALTDYKAQGKTLPHAIVDLQSCTNPSSAYVMVSRVTSLDGLLILRPFEEKENTGPSERGLPQGNDATRHTMLPDYPKP